MELSKRVDVTSPEFYEDFKKDLLSYKQGDLEKFINDEFGISDIMSVEFPDVSDVEIENFNTARVRGNISLMQGKLMTAKHIKDIFLALDQIRP